MPLAADVVAGMTGCTGAAAVNGSLPDASAAPRLGEFDDRRWDVLVVGAGPAGCLAARALAQRGAAVLLVDKETFPRSKVCGCYLNPTALATLAATGLADLPEGCGARPVTAMDWRVGRTRARLALRGGAALSRGALDAALAGAAQRAGATFVHGVRAAAAGVDRDCRRVALRRGGEAVTVRARAVIAADGVAGRFAEQEAGLAARLAAAPRIGIGATLCEYPRAYETGTIYMACGPQGYLGLLRVEGAGLPVAAAVDPAWLRSVGGPARAAAALLVSAGLPEIPGLDGAEWKGTPALTRRRRTRAAERMFVVGDAAGYVEPFTGEGIGWALAGGAAVAEFALQGLAGGGAWNARAEAGWNRWYGCAIRPRQRVCALVTGALRRPPLVAAGVSVLAAIPGALAALIRWVQAAPGRAAWPARRFSAGDQACAR